jgi:hypothetical protein
MPRALLTLACTTALLLGAVQAHAHTILYPSPGAIQPEENLLFNDASLITGPALTVQGITNLTSTVFNLTGAENLVADGGQALVKDEAGDGFKDLLIDALEPDTFFTMFEANLNAASSGVALISATDSTGHTEVFTPFAFDGDGQNYFIVEAINNQLIDSITIEIITQGVALMDLRHIRFDNITTGIPVPDSPALALMAASLLAAALRRRRAVP